MQLERQQELRNTTEHYVTEYLKCKNSFDYFCENYIKIELPGGDVPLRLYRPQSVLIKHIGKERFVLVLKSRQIGVSTVIQAYVTYLCVFFKNVVIGIISKDGPEATDFARHIMGMIDKLPTWMAPKFAKRTEQTFILENGCKCYASPVNPNAPEKTLRGKSVTFLVIDEAAFIQYIDEAWTGMVSALSTNQMHAQKQSVPFGTVILSTPNKTVGKGKWFYQKYVASISSKHIFFPYTIHWKDVRELATDPSWYKTQCELFDNDERKIQQELELKFLSAVGSFFDEKTVQALQDIKIKPIEKIRLFNGEVWKFSDPIPSRYYLIGVDTAPEHGEDMSAITVWDYETVQQVWEYQGKLPVKDFVQVVKVACSQYPGTLVVESNSYGNQVVEEIRSSQYAPMLYSETRGNKKVPGLSTNTKTRPLMIDALYSYITDYPDSVKSQRLILELVGLVSKPSGKVEGDTGSSDDLALSSAVAFYVRKWDPPLMIDSSRFYGESFREIMGLNEMVPMQVNNANILKEVKDHMTEDTNYGGYIDILEFYKE